MSWLTFVLLALVLIFAIQGFRKGMLRMAISMVFFLVVLGVTSWLNPYISDFVREKTTWQTSIEEKCNKVLSEFNPVFKEKKETEQRFSKLESSVEDIKTMISNLSNTINNNNNGQV